MISYDKKLHFAYSTAISWIATGVSVLLGMNWFQAFYAGAGIAFAAGAGKEYGDKLAPGNKWDWKDIIADAAGAVLGAGLICWLGK